MGDRGAPSIASPDQDRQLPIGAVIYLDPRVTLWADGAVLIGGSPWRISRLSPETRAIVRDLRVRGERGRRAENSRELAVYRELIDRGFAYVMPSRRSAPLRCDTVIPAMDRPELLERCLESLSGHDVTVVDDGSMNVAEMADVAKRWHARLIEHPVNRGPSGARNTGIDHTDGDLIAFIDSDCTAPRGWPDSMLHHFDDPAVAAVAPRVVGHEVTRGVIERYESTRSSLDMGINAELVRPGSRLSFVPTAALIVRRAALGAARFDENLRVGEDVDLVWRLVEAGWHVVYDPSVVVRHEIRTDPREWIVRRFQYGTSAPQLEERHPGYLTPAKVSAWNVAALAILAARKPLLAAAVTGVATAALTRQTGSMPHGVLLAGRVVGQGLLADSAAIGHLLRREWWPIGAAALALSPRFPAARVAAATMLAPIALEWVTRDRSLDPVRYSVLRLIDDASYGTGVIVSSLRARRAAPLIPRVRMPRWPSQRH